MRRCCQPTPGREHLSTTVPPLIFAVPADPSGRNSGARPQVRTFTAGTADKLLTGGNSRPPWPGHKKASGTWWFRRLFLGWQMRDSNPRRRCQLIYSQPPLAARVICRTSKEDHPRLQSAERPFPGRSASSNRGQDNFTELLPKNRIEPLRPERPQKPAIPRKNRAVRLRQESVRPASPRTSAACSSVIWFSWTARRRSSLTPSIRAEASGTGLKMMEPARAAAATEVAAVATAPAATAVVRVT